ncbi:hypothetical protein [Sphingomonas sp.]|jgi:hypothetical protein|uniref:hypothetical protein n=1 Tax=Sphingomonas sp. TaxID=28214 RepID=UPI002DEC6E9E|nr:hypothetical protein [Sphingomonas sp.]
MSDSPDLPEEQPASWEQQLEDAAQDATPSRRWAFDAARKKTFLKALSKGATLTEAARAASVSRSTIYLHQKEDANFAAACLAAQKVIAPVAELAAFDRAVTGIEEDVIHYGKHVGTRVKRSDALLQTLLKGSNPEKYGPQAGASRGKKTLGKKRMLRLRQEIRAEIEAELEAEQEAQHGSKEDVIARIMRKLRRLRDQQIRDEGYTEHKETELLIPPGWKLVPIGRANEHIACPTCPMSERPAQAAPALG